MLPLILNYNVIGFMTCFLTEEDSLEESDITFISSVVSLISLSIELIQLFMNILSLSYFSQGETA